MEAAEQQQNNQGDEGFLSQMAEKFRQSFSTQTEIDDLCQNQQTELTALKKKFKEFFQGTEQSQQKQLHQQHQLKECINNLQESTSQLGNDYKDQQDLVQKQMSETFNYIDKSNKFENLLVKQQNEKYQQLAEVVQWGFESLFKQNQQTLIQTQQITQLAQQNGKTVGTSINNKTDINQQRQQQICEASNKEKQKSQPHENLQNNMSNNNNTPKTPKSKQNLNDENPKIHGSKDKGGGRNQNNEQIPNNLSNCLISKSIQKSMAEQRVDKTSKHQSNQISSSLQSQKKQKNQGQEEMQGQAGLHRRYKPSQQLNSSHQNPQESTKVQNNNKTQQLNSSSQNPQESTKMKYNYQTQKLISSSKNRQESTKVKYNYQTQQLTSSSQNPQESSKMKYNNQTQQLTSSSKNLQESTKVKNKVYSKHNDVVAGTCRRAEEMRVNSSGQMQETDRIQQRLQMDNAQGALQKGQNGTGNFNASDIQEQSSESNLILPQRVDIQRKSSHLQAQSCMDVQHPKNNGSKNSQLISLTKNSRENGKYLGKDNNFTESNVEQNSIQNNLNQHVNNSIKGYVGSKRKRWDITALEVKEGKMQKCSSEQQQVGKCVTKERGEKQSKAKAPWNNGGSLSELQFESRSDDNGQLKKSTSSISPTANKQPDLPTVDNSPSSSKKGDDSSKRRESNEDQFSKAEGEGKKTVKSKVVGLKGVTKSKLPRSATTKKKAK